MKYMKLPAIIFFVLIACFNKSQAEEPFWELASMSPPRGQIEYLYSAEGGNMYLTDYFGEMFHTSDYAENWNWLNLNYKYYGTIKVNNNLIASGSKWVDMIGFISGIFKSTDEGKTWFEITGNWNIKREVSKPLKDRNTIYIGVGDTLTSSSDIYCSIDEGNTWDSIGHIEPPGKVDGMWDLLVTNNIMIILGKPADHKDYGGYVFISKDTLKTWKEIYFKDNAFKVIIKSDSEYYSCSYSGIWYTSDYGETWVQKWLPGEPVYTIAFSPDYKDIYANIFGGKNYVCNPCGIKYSNDSGKTWQSAEDFADMPWSKISMLNLIIKDGFIYATPYLMGIFRSDDKGKTWFEKNKGYSGASPSDLAFNDSNIYITTSGIYKSTNGGKNFKYLGLRDAGLTSIAINSKKDIFVGDAGYGEKGIIRSTDGGKTWESINPGLTAVNNILINSKDYTFIPFYRSTDNGETWTETPVWGNRYGINDEGHIFAFFDGYIYRSTDDGINWDSVGYTKVTDGTEYNYGNIVFNKKTKVAGYYDLITIDNGRTWFKDTIKKRRIDNTFYCALDSQFCWVSSNSSGIWRSCDDGATWYKLDTTGLKHKDFGHIGVSPDGHIYVFGSTGGLYRSRERFAGTPGEDFLNRRVFIDASPNPFSQTTTVSFYNYFENVVSIALYNTLGDKVKTVVDNEFYMPGFREVEVSTDGLPSGIYFCRLEGRRMKETIKVIKVE